MKVLIIYAVFEIPKNTFPPIEILIRAMIVVEPSRRRSCEKLLLEVIIKKPQIIQKLII
jgi:hypothetical protein